jgi:hypothetical protein
MRNRLLLTLAGMLVIGLTASHAGTHSAAAAGDMAPAGPIRCLRTVEGGRYAPERALDKARQVLRRRTLTNQNGTIHLIPGTYGVDEVVAISPVAEDALARHYAGVIRRRCGERQAERSWLVVVELSAAQLVLPRQPLLVAPTAHGWRLANPSLSA